MSDCGICQQKIADLGKAFHGLALEVNTMKGQLSTALSGPIEASRLRWTAKEIVLVIRWLVIPVVASACLTYFGMIYHFDKEFFADVIPGQHHEYTHKPNLER